MAGDAPANEGAVTPKSSLGLDNVRLGPFETQILECRTKSLVGENTHVMVMPLRAGESQPGGMQPCPLDCMSYMHPLGSKWEAARCLVVRNMSKSPIFLKKGGAGDKGGFSFPSAACRAIL